MWHVQINNMFLLWSVNKGKTLALHTQKQQSDCLRGVQITCAQSGETDFWLRSGSSQSGCTVSLWKFKGGGEWLTGGLHPQSESLPDALPSSVPSDCQPQTLISFPTTLSEDTDIWGKKMATSRGVDRLWRTRLQRPQRPGPSEDADPELRHNNCCSDVDTCVLRLLNWCPLRNRK